MSVKEAEEKARSEYKNNPEKVLCKLSYSYCRNKALIPYEIDENSFNKIVNSYKQQFPNGTTLDALWAFNGNEKTKNSNFKSRISLALGQIAEMEGRFEIALRNYFECLVLEIVEDLESFHPLAKLHPEWKNNPINYLERMGKRDLLEKGSLVGDRLSMIIKKSKCSKKEVFNNYMFRGAISCCLSIDEINDFIFNSINE